MNRYRWPRDDSVERLRTHRPEDDRTYVMYFGTTRAKGQRMMSGGLSQSGGLLGHGVYLSRDVTKASRRPTDHPVRDKVVVKVQACVGKVIFIDGPGNPLQKTWHDEGYDTAWVSPNCGVTKSGSEVICVWDPDEIKVLEIIKPIEVESSCGIS